MLEFIEFTSHFTSPCQMTHPELFTSLGRIRKDKRSSEKVCLKLGHPRHPPKMVILVRTMVIHHQILGILFPDFPGKNHIFVPSTWMNLDLLKEPPTNKTQRFPIDSPRSGVSIKQKNHWLGKTKLGDFPRDKPGKTSGNRSFLA